jgi:hypothetical protein
MATLEELIAEHGIDAIKEAMGKDAGEAASKEAFNAPKFKVGDTPVSPDDFSQVAAAQSVPPSQPPISTYNRSAISNSDRLDSLMKPKTSPQNMTPVKPDSNDLFDRTNLSYQPRHTLDLEETPGLPNPVNNVVSSQNSSPVSPGLAAGMAGAAGVGALALGGSQQNQLASPPSIADLRKSDDSVPTKGPQLTAKDDSDDTDEEDTDEDDSISATPRAKETSRAPSPADISKTQDLANFMSAQDPQDGGLSGAMHRRDLATLASQMSQAGNIIGGSLAMVGPNSAASKANEENTALAQKIPSDYMAKSAAASDDPNSAISKNYREFLTKYGVKVGPGVTAQQIKDTLLPSAQKEQDLKEKAQAQKDSKQLSMAQINAYRDLQQSNKDRADAEKNDFKDRTEQAQIMKEMNGLTASSRSALGAAATSKQKANRMIQLLQDPNATTNDYSLAATDLSSIVSGTATISGTKDQQYNTLKGTLSKGMQYLSSNPNAPDTPQVKQHMINVAKQMNNISDEVQNHQLRISKAAHSNFYNKHPEEIDNIVSAIQDNGAQEAPPKQSTAQPQASAKPPHEGKYPPGSTVMVKGKAYTVAPNGDDLQEQ